MIANIVQEQELVPMERITVRVNAVQNSMNYQFGEDGINLD
ncbi:class molecular chaperone [Shewanella decolorationis S12]|uniref:Class molecular chaperone n=1 Tax=Shewanella decolorationis S12 TaxID=1353536 RepID=A0ABN0PI34_9GAMM|nr:class molecular chaperone [Shewanella decolorationis S12]